MGPLLNDRQRRKDFQHHWVENRLDSRPSSGTIWSSDARFLLLTCHVLWTIQLIAHMAALAKYNQFSVATPLQSAVAEALEVADKPYRGFEDYYAWLRAE